MHNSIKGCEWNLDRRFPPAPGRGFPHWGHLPWWWGRERRGEGWGGWGLSLVRVTLV